MSKSVAAPICPAQGSLEEYGRLADRHVNSALTQALVAWLKKAL